jgi:ABC-type nitrate/sulfonate/bicarbonate transport system substrate-binding protein
MLDLDELEAKAKAATPGPWEAKVVFRSGSPDTVCGEAISLLFWEESRGHRHRLDACHYGALYLRDAEFISSANPAAILDLIRELREAQAAVAAERESCADVVQKMHDGIIGQTELSGGARLALSLAAKDIRTRGAKGGE